jgi:hypothetical protein
MSISFRLSHGAESGRNLALLPTREHKAQSAGFDYDFNEPGEYMLDVSIKSVDGSISYAGRYPITVETSGDNFPSGVLLAAFTAATLIALWRLLRAKRAA